jgi:hypothetical protein
MGEHFDDDVAPFPGGEQGVDGRQPLGKAHIHHAAAHRDHGAPLAVRQMGLRHNARILKKLLEIRDKEKIVFL